MTHTPEEAARLRSGVWKFKREYSHELGGDMVSWTLDVDLLYKLLMARLKNSAEYSLFTHNKKGYIDGYFGPGTYDAYVEHGRLQALPENMHKPMGLYKEVQKMAISNCKFTNSGTTGGTYTTNTTNDIVIYGDGDLRYKKGSSWEGEKVSKKRKSLVRNLPFVDGGDGLLETLQREFDYWAGDIMKDLFPAEISRFGAEKFVIDNSGFTINGR